MTASSVLLGVLTLTGELSAQTAPATPPAAAPAQVAPAPAPPPAAPAAPSDGSVSDPAAPTDPTTPTDPAAAQDVAPTGEPAPDSPPPTEPDAAIETDPALLGGPVPLSEPAPAEPVPVQSIYPTEPTAEYEPEPPKRETPWPFRQGRISLGLGLGWASAGGSQWTILGVGGGIYAIDGLRVGLDGTFWVGDEPFISTITPSLTYVLHFVPVVQPYVGAFYRHYFLGNNYLDTDSLGARGGVYFVIGRHLVIGGGIVYEHFLDDDVFTQRDDVYPELSITVAF